MKTVIVTGGAAGIGRETVTLFAERGDRVIIADIDDHGAGIAAAEVEANGGTAVAYRLDVSSEGEWDTFARYVETEFGHADVLINNAGVMDLGGFVETPPSGWQRMIDIDLMSVVYGSRAFGRQMIDKGVHGHIVNVSSAAAFLPSELDSAYGVAKAAVLMASRSLRVELASHQIGVSTICPGVIRTNLLVHGTRNGLHGDEAETWAETAGKAQTGLAWTGPDKVARQIVDSVDRNRSVAPVAPEAWFIYYAFRISPALVRAGASVARFECLEAIVPHVRPVIDRLAQRRKVVR